ncbi:MAG: ABC transporter permease, partial [Holophagales bacterium]|nr:ABC transporter permease [Holophagales bacterium]
MPFIRDFRYAIRQLSARPVWALSVVLVLGLGLGATTAVFDLFNLLAWRPVPAVRAGELVKVFTASHRGFTGPYGLTSYPDYRAYRDGAQAFSALAAHLDRQLRVDTGESTRLSWAAAVTGNYFEVLGLPNQLGRAPGVDDDRPGSAPVVMLSHGLWRRLGSDPGVLGTTVKIEDQPFTVIGVAPRGFTSSSAGTVSELFLPLAQLPSLVPEADRGLLEDPLADRLHLMGRLAARHTAAEAQAELQVLARGLDRTTPLADDVGRQLTVTAATVAHPVDLARLTP